MELQYILLNLVPFAPLFFITAALTYWLKKSRKAWLAAAIVSIGVPGCVLTWYLRKLAFSALGGDCTLANAQALMNAMQIVFVMQAIATIVGSVFLAAIAMEKNPTIGWVAMIALLPLSVLTGTYIYFAAGMTAVDGYGC